MRFLAFIAVGVMVVSGISIALPAALGNNSSSGKSPSDITWTGSGTQRTATYTINHLFETYLKDWNWNKSHYNNGILTQPATVGWGSNTPGWNDWQNETTGGYRLVGYGEYTVREDYPYIIVSDPNSATTANYDLYGSNSKLDTRMAIQTWAPYRLTVDVHYEPLARTGGDATHLQGNFPFVPHLGPNMNAGTRTYTGGAIKILWHGNYLTQNERDKQEETAPGGPGTPLTDGTDHYAQWLYGLPQMPGWVANDGYLYELYGNISYDARAARSYLGWDGVGDVRTWFNTNKAAIEAAWHRDWLRNFSDATSSLGLGAYSIFTDYEYGLDNSGSFLGPYLKLDTLNSSATSLSVLMYTGGWGPDAVIMRLIEASNYSGAFSKTYPGTAKLRSGFVDYTEDLYLNVSATNSYSNGTFRQTTMYQMMAWEDPSSSVWCGAWMWEFKHNDYMGNFVSGSPGVPGYSNSSTESSYNSPFNKYDPDWYTPNRYRTDLAPGSNMYGINASYWWAPEARNLSKYETIIFDFNTTKYFASHMTPAARPQNTYTWNGDVIGFTPWGQNPNPPAKADKVEVVSTDTVQRLHRHEYWGTLKLGAGSAPSALLRAGYYNLYKTGGGYINISGGTTSTVMPAVSNIDYWGTYSTGRVYKHGLPYIILDVSPIDHYKIDVIGAHRQGGTDLVKVTAVNSTGQYASGVNATLQPFYNGTVNLQKASGTGVWGANGSSHAWTGNDRTTNGHTGIWWTTITWAVAEPMVTTNITASDGNFSIDVKGFAWFTIVIIPEFTDIVIPVLGMAAIFFVIRTRKKKKNEE